MVDVLYIGGEIRYWGPENAGVEKCWIYYPLVIYRSYGIHGQLKLIYLLNTIKLSNWSGLMWITLWVCQQFAIEHGHRNSEFSH